MGLDMYIFKTNKNEGAIRKLVNDIEKAIQADIQDSVCIGGSYIIMRFIGDDKENSFDKLKPIAYWRKANHIHEWMSKNVLGNKPGKRTLNFGSISKSQLLQLARVCEEVLEHCITQTGEISIDENFCMMMFPPGTTVPRSGDAEYGECFIENVQETLRQVKSLLQTTNFQKSKLFYFAYY